jgi:ElaB/YqjD/DUF883 family membrane-anchored ribosome-binding protein
MDDPTTTRSAEAMSTLKADMQRIKEELKTLGADAIQLPKEVLFGDLERSVRRQPLQSVGIALGIGVIIGLIMRR